MTNGEKYFGESRFEEALQEYSTAFDLENENPVFVPQILLSICKCQVKVCSNSILSLIIVAKTSTRSFT